MTRFGTALNVVCTLLFLPGRLIEEGLHALAAVPVAEAVSVRLDPRGGTAETVVQFREDTPEWAIRAVYVLPEVAAALAGVAVIVWWALGGSVWLPATTLDWALLSLFGAQYLALVLPSAADMDHSPEAP
jgi:hypothetical protein